MIVWCLPLLILPGLTFFVVVENPKLEKTRPGPTTTTHGVLPSAERSQGCLLSDTVPVVIASARL